MPTEGRLHIRFSEADRALLEALTKELGLDDASTTVRFLVRDKSRALGITGQPPPGKKKRRASGT
jgi:hypothetical protein